MTLSLKSSSSSSSVKLGSLFRLGRPDDDNDVRDDRLDAGTDDARLPGGGGSRMVCTMFSISKADVTSELELSEKTCSSVLILAEKRILFLVEMMRCSKYLSCLLTCLSLSTDKGCIQIRKPHADAVKVSNVRQEVSANFCFRRGKIKTEKSERRIAARLAVATFSRARSI